MSGMAKVLSVGVGLEICTHIKAKLGLKVLTKEVFMKISTHMVVTFILGGLLTSAMIGTNPIAGTLPA